MTAAEMKTKRAPSERLLGARGAAAAAAAAHVERAPKACPKVMSAVARVFSPLPPLMVVLVQNVVDCFVDWFVDVPQTG